MICCRSFRSFIGLKKWYFKLSLYISSEKVKKLSLSKTLCIAWEWWFGFHGYHENIQKYNHMLERSTQLWFRFPYLLNFRNYRSYPVSSTARHLGTTVPHHFMRKLPNTYTNRCGSGKNLPKFYEEKEAGHQLWSVLTSDNDKLSRWFIT